MIPITADGIRKFYLGRDRQRTAVRRAARVLRGVCPAERAAEMLEVHVSVVRGIWKTCGGAK